MTRKITGGAVALALTLAAAAPAAAQAPLRFTESELFIEINATDGDAGLQMQLGGEEWERLRLIDPRGRTIMNVRTGGSLDGYGLTDMVFESNEPPFRRVPFRRFRERFPEGRYRFEGTSVSGRRLIGSDRLTHVVPVAPRVLAPTRNAVVDPGGLTVQWEPVTRPQGIRIVRYQVVVSVEGPGGGDFEVDLPPSATSATVPPGFLARGARHAVEVIARATNGNQTITEVRFRTAA